MEIKQRYEVVRIDGDVDVLKEHPRNPNRGQVGEISESIELNGWYGAVIAQESTGYILAGNHRYRVAKSKGATEIPVIWRDVDDDTALAILLADNEIARHAVYDEAVLEELLADLEAVGRGLAGTGFSKALERLEEEEEAPEPEEGAAADEEPPVPDDEYTPTYGVMVVVDTEEAQARLYRAMEEVLRGDSPADAFVDVEPEDLESAQLRVVAV
jgi:hypothetical protein